MFEAEVEKNLFLVSLINTTIQDGGKREKEYHFFVFFVYIQIKKTQNKIKKHKGKEK